MCSILFFRIGFGRLEDPDSGEVKQFVQEQVRLTESVLKSCDAREKLRDKITKLFDHPRYDVPFKRGDKYFYFHNTGLQAQNVLYVQVNLWIIINLAKKIISFIFFFPFSLKFYNWYRVVWMESQRCYLIPMLLARMEQSHWTRFRWVRTLSTWLTGLARVGVIGSQSRLCMLRTRESKLTRYLGWEFIIIFCYRWENLSILIVMGFLSHEFVVTG